jgi:hypothetical protein
MFNRSNLIAKSTAIAAFFAAMYLPSNAASAASTSYVIPPRLPAVAGVAGGGTSPDIGLCLKYNATPEWVQISASPSVWELELTGEFCPPIILYTCTGTESFCAYEYAIHHVVYVKSYNIASHFLKAAVVVPIGPNGTGVLTTTGKSWSLVDTLQLPVSSGLSATAVAVNSKTQTTYVSVSNTLGSGQAAVLVYQGGSTTPTARLTDPAAGPTAAGVAVDSLGNVFWAGNDASGNGFLDEFEANSEKIKRFNVELYGPAGDLEFDRRDNLLVAMTGISSIQSFDKRMDPGPRLTVTGAPASMSLDAKDANLYVIDSTNNLIDQYAYPSGKLVSSNPPQQLDGQTPFAAAVLAPQ